jgi:acyl-CoA thioesterase I
MANELSFDIPVPADLIRFRYPLPHLTRGLKGQAKIKIVAIGSSSTAGEGGIVPYPSRLEAALRRHFPNQMIDVVNKGVGGQEAPEELKRFPNDVFGEGPVLTIWQVGTNAIFHNDLYKPNDVAAAIATGLNELSGRSMDVLLMDLQYAPAILKPEKIEATERMISLIAAAAGKASVNLFCRFALMQHWHVVDGIPFAQMIDPTDGDQLHQSDWSTEGVAQALSGAIVKAAGGEGVLAGIPR